MRFKILRSKCILHKNDPLVFIHTVIHSEYKVISYHKELVINTVYFKRFKLPTITLKTGEVSRKWRIDKNLWERKYTLLGIPYYIYAIREGAKLNKRFRLFKYPNPDYFTYG